MNRQEIVLWVWDKHHKTLHKNMVSQDKNKTKWLFKVMLKLIKLNNKDYLIVKLFQLKQQF